MLFLEMKNITKSFGATKALSGVSISIEAGDILGLCGENGAGKSTLMKILSGVYTYGSYEGNIFINGLEAHFRNIVDAEKAGIAIIHQELNLIPEMTVSENIWLGRYLNNFGILKKDEMIVHTNNFLSKVAPNINPNSKIKDLGTGEKQIVEIVHAVSKNAKILIFDEPTSSLTGVETRKLISLINDLKNKGVTVIYISHKLNEIFELSNKIAVIRDGLSICLENTKDLNEKKVISMMVGREIDISAKREKNKIGDIVFEAKNYTAFDIQNSNIKKVDNASFYLREGEILGFSGLIGAGRTELMTSIFGSYKGNYKGESFYKGKKLNIKNPKDAIKEGIAYAPEERKINGLIFGSSIKKNITLSTIQKYASKYFGIINNDEERRDSQKSVLSMLIKIPSLEHDISSLSGGNQQKCVLANRLLIKPKILILDEPTRGIDIGAKFEIYKQIKEIAKKGTSVILVSSELSEILSLSDRVIVMHEGVIKGSLDNNNLTQTDIMTAAIGAK